MSWYFVRIEKTKRQTRITIPKDMAIESGLHKQRLCKIRVNKNKAIVIEVVDIEKTES